LLRLKKSHKKKTGKSWGVGGPPQTLWNGNSRGVEGGVKTERPSVGGIWVFSGNTHSRFRRLKEHYEKHGIALRQHGNTKRLPENMLPQSTTEDVPTFIVNVEENAISLPGRIQSPSVE